MASTVAGPSFTLSPAGTGSVSRPNILHQPTVGTGLPMWDPELIGTEGEVPGPFGSYGAATLLASAALLAGSTFLAKSQPKVASKKERCLVSLAAFENELGVQAPVGFWDPLGFTADGNVASFKRRRSVEIKHSRVCMMASIGYIQPEFTGKWPGFLSPSAGLKFADIPNGLAAISKVPALGWAQIVAYSGFIEFSGGFEDYKSGTPGDYGWKVITSGDQTQRTKKLAAEIANGRLGMFSIIGMFFQDGLTGSAWGDWALYTGSPLRAFEKELGVQAPFGYWDPFGLARGGDVATFYRRRVTEIKHGRICMFASLGYIVAELYRWPGFISPTTKLAFADIPNGLGALSKVPTAGWLQVLGFIGGMERTLCNQEPNRAPGDCSRCGVLGVPGGTTTLPQGEEKTRKLSAELANGRLAMMAIIGMFYQDGLTGSAWGDWSLYTDSPLRAFESELGVQAPLGYWDPLGLSREGDAMNFRRRRSTELKHGRVSMIACIGYMVPEFFKWDGTLSTTESVAQGMGKLAFADIPNGLGALPKIPFGGWHQIVVFCAIMELNVLAEDPTRPPGDIENCGILGIPGPKTTLQGEEKIRRLNGELANGRLAMFSIIGLMVQDGLTGEAWGDWSLYEDSPLRAFENDLGVQAPVGYWDPFGLALDGNAQDFARRRVTEIKHGRVCMFACLGYMVPEYFRWPGYCMGDSKLPFADIPNGLVALKKIPLLGWFQILLFIGVMEKAFWNQDDSRAPGDYERAGVLGIINGAGMPNGPSRTRRLNAEIANGRLAMFALTGMLAQDGLTGKAWGDWTLYTTSPLRAFENDLDVEAM